MDTGFPVPPFKGHARVTHNTAVMAVQICIYRAEVYVFSKLVKAQEEL